MTSALGLDITRGRTPPADDASLEEKVQYLLAQDERHLQLINDLENLIRAEPEAIRKELDRVAAELRETRLRACARPQRRNSGCASSASCFCGGGIILAAPPTSSEEAPPGLPPPF